MASVFLQLYIRGITHNNIKAIFYVKHPFWIKERRRCILVVRIPSRQFLGGITFPTAFLQLFCYLIPKYFVFFSVFEFRFLAFCTEKLAANFFEFGFQCF